MTVNALTVVPGKKSNLKFKVLRGDFGETIQDSNLWRLEMFRASRGGYR